METRALVLDVDDTICRHVNRDYVNAAPNEELIGKINELHRAGWRIILFTARGMVSCNGDVSLIEEVRGPVLRDWLKTHGVEYDELRFGKPIAVYYVDDKALRPDEFIKLQYRQLKGGSGAKIEVIGNRVIKYAPNVLEQANWYREATGWCNVPFVHQCYAGTLDMEYIENGMPLNDNCTVVNLRKVLKTIQSFRQVSWEYNPWSTMVERVQRHMAINAVPFETEITRLIDMPKIHDYFNKHASFCHGDTTLENLVLNHKGIYFIDPNVPPNLYTSWLLDLGKLYQSIHSYYEERFSNVNGAAVKIKKESLYPYLKSKMGGFHRYVLLVELIHFIRILKYKSNFQKTTVRVIIEELWQEVAKCFSTELSSKND